MAEYTYNPIQLVQPGQAALFNNSIPCRRGYVYHRNESGIVTLCGAVNNPCADFARYQVTFNGNIAAPTAAGAIAVALAINGEPILTSRAIATPTAVDAYFNVTSTAIITVPRGCCFSLSVENVTEAVGAAAPQAINVQNANLTITRIA